jgi:uncharacterized protein YfiM (DUF2279 family)
MANTLTVAGLLIDSWRDQSSHTEPSEMNLLGGANATNRLRGASDDSRATPRLESLIALGAVKWESRQGENP